MNMIYTLDPLVDARWGDLIAHHVGASAFHQRGWLEALSRTYGYQPLVITTSPPGEPLQNGIVLCRVCSWITGTRLVSLPFSDHCDPLLDDNTRCRDFMDWLRAECLAQRYKYCELRPLLQCRGEYGLQPSQTYCFHELDIQGSLEQIFCGFHRDSIQRRIRRAEKEGLACETGHSEELMNEFFRLLLITRKRHQLPPQPRTWFSNLLQCMGDNIQVRVARHNNRPIAALLTLRHRSTVIYKYGCSDERFHNVGAMPLLFWRLIEESKALKAERVDFGRSDLYNKGLITFKDKFGSTKRYMTYYRYPVSQKIHNDASRGLQTIRQCVSLLPDSLMSVAGKILYRHMG